jgi:hypothetical protein
MGGANGSHECAPDDKLRDTHPSEFEKMMDFSERLNPSSVLTNPPCRLQPFPGCCAAPSARLRASSTRYDLRRVALPGSIVWPGVCSCRSGSAEQREGRCTASGTRETVSPTWGDLPVGRFVDRRVESLLQKYFCFHPPQIISRTLAIPSHKRGVGHRHERGRDAVDAAASCAQRGRRAGDEPVSDRQHADERCCCGRRSRVVLTPRRWCQVRGG